MIRPFLRPFACLAALAALPAAAGAEPTQWHCWLQGDQHVSCVLAQAAPAAALSAGQARQLAEAPGVTPPARAGADGLPASVGLIRRQPGALAGQLIRIPLHTEPYDTASVAELAQAVMCGRASDCRVDFGAAPGGTLARAAALADAHDPLLHAR